MPHPFASELPLELGAEALADVAAELLGFSEGHHDGRSGSGTIRPFESVHAHVNGRIRRLDEQKLGFERDAFAPLLADAGALNVFVVHAAHANHAVGASGRCDGGELRSKLKRARLDREESKQG